MINAIKPPPSSPVQPLPSPPAPLPSPSPPQPPPQVISNATTATTTTTSATVTKYTSTTTSLLRCTKPDYWMKQRIFQDQDQDLYHLFKGGNINFLKQIHCMKFGSPYLGKDTATARTPPPSCIREYGVVVFTCNNAITDVAGKSFSHLALISNTVCCVQSWVRTTNLPNASRSYLRARETHYGFLLLRFAQTLPSFKSQLNTHLSSPNV